MNMKEMIFRQGKRQVEVAKKVGCTEATLSKYLCGWADLPKKYKKKLCIELKIKESELDNIIREK